MTDEEMAYEYAKYDDNGRVSVNDDKFKAFLAGLKVGRLEWYRVDKEVLPDNSRYVWTNVGPGYHDEDSWWDDFGRLQGVIAWCEPQFKEE